MLLIGAGGLGAPASLYLAAAGVGTLGIVDFDVVDLSNLQRQIVHTTDRVGEKKVDSARKTLNALNPDVNVIAHEEMLVADNVDRIIAGYDVVLDGTDTFETRYILNDAAVAAGIPVVHASVFRFEGQLTTFVPVRGPVLPLPLPDAAAARARPRLLRRRRAGRRARDHGPAPGQRGPQAPARHRRDPRRPAAAVRCPRDRVHGAARCGATRSARSAPTRPARRARPGTPIAVVDLRRGHVHARCRAGRCGGRDTARWRRVEHRQVPGRAAGERRRRARGRGAGLHDRRGARHARRRRTRRSRASC